MHNLIAAFIQNPHSARAAMLREDRNRTRIIARQAIAAFLTFGRHTHGCHANRCICGMEQVMLNVELIASELDRQALRY